MTGENPQVFRSYPQRWAIMAAFFFLAFFSAASSEWDPILDKFTEFLEITHQTFIYVQSVLAIVTIFTTFACGYMIDIYGIRFSFYAAASLRLVANVLSCILFHPVNFGMSFTPKIMLFGVISTIDVVSTPFIMCLPFKISEAWFSEKARTTAWAIMTSSFFIGVSISAFVNPLLIQDVSDFKYMFYLNLFNALFIGPFVYFSVQQSQPPTPPALRASRSNASQQPFSESLKHIVATPDIAIHLIATSANTASSVAFVSHMQKLLISSGHDRALAGKLIAVQTLSQSVLQIPFAQILTKLPDSKLTIVCKLSIFLQATTFGLWTLTCLSTSTTETIIFGTGFLQMLIACASTPVYQNMTAILAVNRVPEGTIAAARIIGIMITAGFTKSVSTALIVPTANDMSDFTGPVIFLVALNVAIAAVHIIFFSGEPSPALRDVIPSPNQNPADSPSPSSSPETSDASDAQLIADAADSPNREAKT